MVDWRLRNKQSTDHVEHGRSAAKWELHSGERVKNPHQPGSDEHREWQFGYNEEKGIKKEEAAESTAVGPDKSASLATATDIFNALTKLTFGEMTKPKSGSYESASFVINGGEEDTFTRVTVTTYTKNGVISKPDEDDEVMGSTPGDEEEVPDPNGAPAEIGVD